MAFPNNITKEDLLNAVEKIDTEGIPSDGDSQYYDVVYNNKRYPPKLIVSYANLFANGEVLDRKTFEGGIDTRCFKLLERNNFVIIKKNGEMSYYDELKKFLEQSKTGELATGSYTNSYMGTHVKVSFGKGNPARIPWIAFLKDGQTVQDGIYPDYLFFKDKRILVLAYGVSETNKPSVNWNLPDLKPIKKYFIEKNLGNPDRYGSSFVFKTYDTDKSLDKETIDNDLQTIIGIYNKISFAHQNIRNHPIQGEKIELSNVLKVKNSEIDFNHSGFYNECQSANFLISENLALRFIASLLTKPFVILTGLSGSGKSKLAQTFSMWLCEYENQYCIIPVGADWTNREPLLGFPNALEAGKYVKPDNRVLDLIIEANENAEKPYFLILDEMNLSHVERYFADFLSVMESHQDIFLHAGDESWSDIPSRITLPQNLFIIGTVNIDETTYMFSPKVLDRANVIEFRVTADEMETFLSDNQNLNLDLLKNAGENMANSFVTIANDKSIQAKNVDELKNTLVTFFDELKKTGAEFGFRTASEILRFTAIINHIEPDWTIAQIIDAAIMQKLLPKVHGSRRKLEPILKTLAKLCLKDNKNLENYLSAKMEINFEDSDIKYPLSLEKIVRMNQSLLNNGFTSYAEA